MFITSSYVLAARSLDLLVILFFLRGRNEQKLIKIALTTILIVLKLYSLQPPLFHVLLHPYRLFRIGGECHVL